MSAWESGAIKNMAPPAKPAVISKPVSNCWPGKSQGSPSRKLPSLVSRSLAKATMLPEKVSPPIRTANKMVTPRNQSDTGWEKYSAVPTSRLATPPKPLKRATISGIAVMATRRAATMPTIAPSATPAASQRNLPALGC